MKKYIDNPGIHPDKYVEWFLPICIEICRVIKPTGSFILNINDKVEDGFRHPYVFDLISELHKKTDLKMFERLFWNKLKGLPNRNRFGDRAAFFRDKKNDILRKYKVMRNLNNVEDISQLLRERKINIIVDE
jgi:hypothetical protein